MIIRKKRLKEIIYNAVMQTAKNCGYNMSETKKLMIYNKIINEKRTRKGK